ncbi:hypothetical protein K1T71_010491 [Dendrolimus kikuchii]|uniref:Uncharacterized protein n=1 Tax=Dendrolimus kikuchii TaxID=765133 RepID=A0ACC1CRV8_9NEOP|nr:hypothetical protein K1T71_010491 [Dendrolimus kikuchii]
MDEIEYKLNTNNSVLVVNAIDKLISAIKSKFKPAERQRFVLENEELKFLRDKCSSKDPLVSLTACQGLLALVELGILEIAHTMSTVVTLLPSAHNYSAIISTMAGLLILDLKSRLSPGQQYKCQFTLKSPQHPFITVLEKNMGAEDDVLAQMHALCAHPDYIVSSNSLELLRPVFLWLTCHPQRSCGIRPWQLILSLSQTNEQSSLLLACLSCQQICNPDLIERAYSAYSAVTDTAIYQQNRELVMTLLPVLARISNELIKHGRDPRGCYNLMGRCFALDAPELKTVAGITIMLLADNLTITSALHLHELFNLCLNIVNKYEYTSLSIGVFTSLTLQWLHLPSYLTASALQTASKILEIQKEGKTNSRLHMPNLKANKIFQALLYTDSRLSIVFKLNQIWERLGDSPANLKMWLESLKNVDSSVVYELLPFFLGILMLKKNEEWFEDIILYVLDILLTLIDFKKEVSVQLLPVLVYNIGNNFSARIKLECLKALPLMAKTKVRCFPYLQEMLVEQSAGRPDDLKWELDIARAMAVNRICEIRASSHGLELVSVISSILNRCGDKSGSAATCLALRSLVHLWRGAAVAPPSTWRALEPKLGRDGRPLVQVSLCQLLSEVPALRVSSPEYDKLLTDAARRLWLYVSDSNHPEVVEAACLALSGYRIEDYKLKDIPEIYRRTVKLPASYCKTPADAARKPEDVLDYLPCEVWPEVFKCTNQSAIPGVVGMVSKLVEREVKGYRGGVYQLEMKQEPLTLNHLPPSSVVRGLMECFRRQATSPSYDFPEAVLLAILQALAAEYPRPLPPLDLRGCLRLCSAQAQVAPSARRILDSWLQGVVSGGEESDAILMFELLLLLCRGMPPNSLRPPLEKCLGEAYSLIANVKKRNDKEANDYLFVKQMEMIRECLECERIHDANRTLLSQIVENYFSVINDHHVAWPTYLQTCRCLSTKYLERMSSPSAWWEVTGELIRKAGALRCIVATAPDCTKPLVWLNEIIDAQAMEITEQEFSLRCMVPALKVAKADDPNTKDWFLQLMARTQVAFTETEEQSAKLYLCDVFMLSVVMFSGHWSFEPDKCCGGGDVRMRTYAHALMPAAAAALFSHEAWSGCTLQMLEWLCHTRDLINDATTAQCCQRTLLAMRHTQQFATHKIWIKLESHFGKDIVDE